MGHYGIFFNGPKASNFDGEGIYYQDKYLKSGLSSDTRLIPTERVALYSNAQCFRDDMYETQQCFAPLALAQPSLYHLLTSPSFVGRKHQATHTTEPTPVNGYIAKWRPEDSVTAKSISCPPRSTPSPYCLQGECKNMAGVLQLSI